MSTVQPFRRNWFDKQDPTDSIGTLVYPFSYMAVYTIDDPNRMEKIRVDIYKKIEERFKAANLPDVTMRQVTYSDALIPAEAGRKYIIMHRETPRETRLNVIARVLPYGDTIFFRVDSFVLGQLNTNAVLQRLAITLVCSGIIFLGLFPSFFSQFFGVLMGFGSPYRGMTGYGSPSGEMGGLICCFPVYAFLALVILMQWIDVIRNYSHEKDLSLAMRQAMNRDISDQSFNTDDVLMSIKSTVQLVIYAIRDTLQENGIAVKSLDDFIAQFNTINNVQNIYNNAPNSGAQGVFRAAVGFNK